MGRLNIGVSAFFVEIGRDMSRIGQRRIEQQFLWIIVATFLSGLALSSHASAAVVQTWGWNAYRQLGDGTTTNRSSPVIITSVGSDVSAVSAGYDHTLFLKDGAVWATGMNTLNGTVTGFDYTSPAPVSSLQIGVTKIVIGNGTQFAIKDGSLLSWGINSYGQLGAGISTDASTPVPVVGMATGVTSVAVGHFHSLAVQNGAAFGWGLNSTGQLGDGTTTNRKVPTAAPGLAAGVTAVAGGWSHSLAVKDGAVYAWGDNVKGALGDGTTTAHLVPAPVSGLTDGVTDIAAGANFSLAIRNGNLYGWGANSYNGVFAPGNTLSPVMVLDLPEDLIKVSTTSFSSAALSQDGSLWVWGSNEYGQLGVGGSPTNNSMGHLLPPTGYRYTDIDAGDFHMVATLVAVPEPSSLALLGLGGMLLIRRRVCHT